MHRVRVSEEVVMYFLIKVLLMFLCTTLICAQFNKSLSSNFCETLDYNKVRRYIREYAIDKIELGAFDACPNLEVISISGTLDMIDPNIFRNNQNLEEIQFDYAGLRKIHGSTFVNLNNLTILQLNHNSLIDFPVYQFPILPSLRRIGLDNNALSDLNVEEMLDKFPSLQRIALHSNFIECNRFKVINETLTSRNIIINKTVGAYNGVLPFDCISTIKIDSVFKDANLSIIRGRLDNEVVKDEVKQLKVLNKELQENFTRVDQEIEAVLVNITEVQRQLNRIMDVASFHESFFLEERTTAENSNFIIFGIVGFTLFLAIVVGFLVKCFITMRHDLQMLRKQEEEKSNQSKEQRKTDN